MNDARALLDSLMGQTRNEAPKEKKKKGDRGRPGEGFKDDSVCKLWLAGFCPEHEELFYNTKRDLGACRKTHYEMHKEEFIVHPDKHRLMNMYEEELLTHLGRLLRETRDIVSREKIKYEQYLKERRQKAASSNEDKDPRGDNMKELASKWLAEAEELAEQGDLAGSKRKMADARAAEEKAKEWEEEQGPPNVAEKICDICGERKDTEKKSAFKHEAGRVHQGVLLMQSKLAELKKKEESGKLKVDRDLLKEEEVRKERAARDEKEKRREKDRADRERKVRQREKEEREEVEREERRKEMREEEKRKQELEAEETKRKQEEQAVEEAKRKELETEKRREKAEKASKKSRSRSRVRREDGEAKKKDRSRSRGRRGDRERNGDAEASKSKSGDKKEKDDGSEESKQAINKARFIEKQFMDLMLHARLTPMDTYEDVEGRLGKKEQWAECPEQSRRELLGAWLDALKKM